ncbi:TetR/AcrR family transcriptional regulator [Brevibacterium aurantiacum]|uniref:TetR family transcriptional regulator n=1 Tax=Brevibacterium aurantiacum TaxID=273384 RepID=A0A556CEB5_BREAU|nr:TetR/AcrR family transcriptional regulator C-terminal domain-containing protein [Brevibacterium aurantiacum]TSI15388.1 TetR family transcriptional regulator [Brevibacterium aurantiacum]
MARPVSPLLNRKKIAHAAIEMIDAGHELKIQPLAKKLGVSLSSLYHHVDGRDGIVHAMREVLSSEYEFTPPSDPTWKAALRAGVSTLWRLYSDHPRVMIHLLGVTIHEPETLRLYESLVAQLRQAGLPEEEILTTLEVLDAFAFGVALDALSPAKIFAPEGPESPMADLLQGHPTGRERNERLYERGLDIIIAGIESRVP